MRIGVPREIKPLEGRVGLVPEAAAVLVRQGHEVYVEKGAGEKSGYPDEAYLALGITVLPDAPALYGESSLIIKVKEPVAPEISYLRADHILFSYLHLAAAPELARELQAIGLTALAFETVEDRGGLPLLAPMSDIAGRLSIQIGAHLLHQPMGGRGILLGGLPAAKRGHVVVLGGGTAGSNAAAMAASIGARVTVFDHKREKLERLRALGANVTALYSYHDSLVSTVQEADLLVGAVLRTGHRAPHLVTRDMVRSMKEGTVIVDISVDQGGCVETTRATTYEDPTYVAEEVIHFGVSNMPGAVPRSASQALSAALIPYVKLLATPDWEDNPPLRGGLNIRAGALVHPALIEDLGESS